MWARIIDQNGIETVAEVVDFNPSRFGPEIAALFVPATDGMVYRAEKRDGVWVAPPAPDPTPEPVEPEPTFLREISPVAFLLMFSPQERVAIRLLRAKASNPQDNAYTAALIVDDWMKIVEDPRLQIVNLNLASAQAGIDFLTTLGILTKERAEQIKQGIPGG
jgi:hypothetical protein